MDNLHKKEPNRFLKTELQCKIAGYFSAFICSTTAAIVVMSGQVINENAPPFQVSLIRFGFQAALGAFLMINFGADPRIPFQWKPIGVMCAGVAMTFGAGVLFMLSSWYLPVTVVHGTMEAVVMILAGLLACMRKKCYMELPIGIAICSVGCLLLSQPEFMFHNFPSNITNTLNPGTIYMKNCTEINLCENVKVFDMILNCTTTFCSRIIHHQSSKALYGFIFTLGLGFCLWQNNQFNVKYLLDFTPVSSILFWFGLGCTLVTTPIMLIAEYPIQPISQPFIILMVAIFAVSFSLNVYSIIYTVTLIPFSHAAMVLPTAMVYLYIFQKTFLKDIQPGPDNWLETVGLVMVMVGSLIPPTFDIGREKFKGENEKVEKKPLVEEAANVFKYDSLLD